MKMKMILKKQNKIVIELNLLKEEQEVKMKTKVQRKLNVLQSELKLVVVMKRMYVKLKEQQNVIQQHQKKKYHLKLNKILL